MSPELAKLDSGDRRVTFARLNLISALGSLLGSIVFLVAASTPSALIWLAASIVWFVMAALGRRHSTTVDFAGASIARRFLRLFLFS
jgi:hypothetical protein